MIKDVFNRNYPIDKTMVGRFGRYSIIRGSYPGTTFSGDATCRYGIFIPNNDLTPITEGIALSYEEMVELANILPTLIESGAIRPTTSGDEYRAIAAAKEEAAKNAPRRAIW